MNYDEYQALLKDSELRLDRLRSLYEQWFQGIERREPREQREELERRVALFRRQPARNTALRFRTQTLIQRFVSLQTYWTRVAREIEQGTHIRDLQRARRRSKARDEALEREKSGNGEKGASAAKAAYELDLDLDFDAAELAALEEALTAAPERIAAPPPPAAKPAPGPPAAKPGAPPPPPKPASPPPVAKPGAPPPVAKPAVPPPLPKPVAPPPLTRPSAPRAVAPAAPAAPAAPTPQETRFARPKGSPPSKRPGPPVAPASAGPSDAGIREIYDRYVAARRKNNERVDNLKLEAVAASIKKMMPGLEEKHRGKRIDFEVVVKDGRVGLKPVAKD